MIKKLNYINGEWVGNESDSMSVINPATGEQVGIVPRFGTEETRLAIDAAEEAFATWSQTTPYERAAFLEKLHTAILDNKEELAEIMTLEMGKPIKESIGEVDYSASFIDWFAAEGKRTYGQTIPTHDRNKRLQVWKQPVGVVAAITPWNFPLAMLARKMAPALAAGCTLVIKPSSESPLTAIRLVELCEEVGFPKGVVNIVTGSSRLIGDEILSNQKVRKITFTGSTEVGKQLMEKGAQQMKRLSLELGGHAPIIVLDDANLGKAVEGAIASKFRNSGQTCICGNRIYVQSSIYEQFITKFTEAVEKFRIGNGMDEENNIGPLINQEAVEKVASHVKDAVEKGAKVTVGGAIASHIGESFYQPTVIRDVNESMLIMNEETFGPVAPIQKFDYDEEAIQLANNTPYGLAAYVFTESNSRGIRLIEKLNYGIVGWNDGSPSAAHAPFGGMKESGIGREGGQQGIEDFLEKQYVSIGI